MIVNRYAKKCQSCKNHVGIGQGFAYNNGNGWYTVCASTACHRHLGLKVQGSITNPDADKEERKITAQGFIYMPFDRAALPLLRTMPGAKFRGAEDKDNQTPGKAYWEVSTKPADLPRVLEVCEQLKLDIPDELRGKLGTDESRAAVDRAIATSVNGKTLYEFQTKGVEFLALHDRAFLADDMGLGKTIQAIVALPENERVVVVCPASVKYNWRDEIQLWRSSYKVTICNGRESFVLPGNGEIVICNYDILPAFLTPSKKSGKQSRRGKDIMIADMTAEQAIALGETIVIGDEAHLVKNYKAARSKKFEQLARTSKRTWLLSGTPLMNHPLDLFGVLCSGNMNVFGSFEKFLRLFNGFPNGWGGYDFPMMPSAEVPELLHRVMMRRLKSEVLKDLPPKTYKDIEVEISADVIKRLNAFLRKVLEENGEDVRKLDDEAIADKLDLVDLPMFSQYSEIRALLAYSRIPAMLEIVESYEDSETPLVVFSDHVAPIKELGKREGWKVITGETGALERRDIVQEFQDGLLKGIGLTIGAGGTGITLTRASHVLFVDLNWTPALNIQAEDRVLRIGQTAESILIMRMSSSHPLDQHIQKLLRHKLQLANAALEASIKFRPLPPRKPGVAVIEETDEELLARIKEAEDEAEREFSLGKLHGILGRECAKVNDVPEPELTTGRKAMLRNALEYMISICDFAETRDGMGFNKPDAHIARWVGYCLRDEDEVSYRVLERILVRYRRQLKGKFMEIWDPAFERKAK